MDKLIALLISSLLFIAPPANSGAPSSKPPEDLLKRLQDELVALKIEIRRDARIIEKHDSLIFKLEEMVIKQADVIKSLDVSAPRQGLEANDFVRRSCHEIHSFNPLLPSGLYWIDPDGQGVGHDPIVVHCDMTTGATLIPHDSEMSLDMGSCKDPGCYAREITYRASMRQMLALIELSGECRQGFRYDCINAPFDFNGQPQSWWLDRNGAAHYFWAGSNSSAGHTCQCGIDGNCIDPKLRCNCDAMSPVPTADFGFIVSKDLLPIKTLRFGRTLTSLASGKHTLGRLECVGSAMLGQTPSSCRDLWHLGHHRSGFYLIRGVDGNIATVHCDMTKTSDNESEKLIGNVDVKSAPVYFYVQRYHHYSTKGSVIPFEVERLNVGGGMDVKTGVFTAPVAGVYFFGFNGLKGVDGQSALQVHLQVNGQTVGTGHVQENSGQHWQVGVSLQSTVSLKKGDKVTLFLNWGSLFYLANHFTGILLHEQF